MCFFVLRQHSETVQGLLTVDDENVSKPMVKWAQSLPRETIVLVEGVVQQPIEPLKSTTVKDAEIKIYKVRASFPR
jgi:aspartyl/asparaginyl-tRNA synthetase